MKKLLCGIMLVTCFLTFSGCQLVKPVKTSDNPPKTDSGTVTPSTPDNNEAADPGKTPSSGSSTYKIEDYFPFKANTLYTFEGKGNEFAGYTVWIDYIKENKIQQRVNNGGTELSKVIENKDGELKVVFSREETYYREDFTSKAPNKDEILLKEPLVEGTTWNLSDGRKRSITNLSAEISTPSGNYKALEVTTEGADSQSFDYYVLNIGLVKSIYKAKDMEVTSSLSEVKDNASLVQDIEFYFPNNVSDKIILNKKKLSFKTNDITKMTLEKELKNAPSNEFIKLMPSKSKINILYLNNDGMVYVDFTESYVTDMNLGSGYEGMALQSMANTLGRYYGAKKVYVTVEGKPYSSGHIIMEKGEAFTVNTSDITEP